MKIRYVIILITFLSIVFFEKSKEYCETVVGINNHKQVSPWLLKSIQEAICNKSGIDIPNDLFNYFTGRTLLAYNSNTLVRFTNITTIYETPATIK